MSVNKVIVVFCNKSTILMKLEKKLDMRDICIVKLHGYAKGELCTTNVEVCRRNVGVDTNQLIDQLIDRYSVKALMDVRERHTCKIMLLRFNK